jgi:hypothetical protein
MGETMTLAFAPGACVRAWFPLAAAGCVLASLPALAGTIKDQMAKLDPEERAHQACAIKGLEVIRHDKKLPGADHLKTGIFGRAVYVGNEVTAKGGAVKAHDHWYKLKFSCTVTADQMKATAFTYEIGPEVPPDKWEDLGLW